MKFYIRRAVFAIITAPVIFLAYGVIYFGIGLLATQDTASVGEYLHNLWSIGFGYFVFIVFYPQLMRLADKAVE